MIHWSCFLNCRNSIYFCIFL